MEELRASKGHFVCAGYGFIDLGAAHDAPSYYFREDSRALVSVCGGACMGATGRCMFMCPPSGWDADGCNDKYQAWYERKKP